MAEPTGLEPATSAACMPLSPNFLAIYSHQSRLLPPLALTLVPLDNEEEQRAQLVEAVR